MKDWYRILQVSERAAEAEIKASYRALAKKYHPDAHPGDRSCEERFREISEAYSILSDPEKRREYDAQRNQERNWTQGRGGANPSQGKRTMPKTAPIDFQNINKNFEQFFGFNPETKNIVNEDKLNPNKRNPLDATDLFERFMGIKR